MTVHLQREIDRLKRKILALGAAVEESVRQAAAAMANRDPALAKTVDGADQAIDRMEVDVEEDCLKILALHQPVAIDLRFIIAVLKINNDLERVGDLAVNVAQECMTVVSRGDAVVAFDFRGMAERAQTMLRMSLDALVNLDVNTARAVLDSDDEMDALNWQALGRMEEALIAHPERTSALVHMLRVPRLLERIADHATNIAEDVIYMVNGEIVRHKEANHRPAAGPPDPSHPV
jgi:phosphate transport system protein